MKIDMKRHMKSLMAAMLSLAVVLNGFSGLVYNVNAQETKQYKEMKFGDWGKQVGTNGLGYNKYELTDASTIDSLDGVAISGKVKFNGVTNKYLTFGGTDRLDHAGFWIKTAGEGRMELTVQGITGVTPTGTGHQFTNAAFKINEEINLRVTFDNDKTAKTWTVTVYADDVPVGSNIFDFSNATEGLKLYVGIPAQFTVDQSSDSKEYTELTLGDWSKSLGSLYNCDIYQLSDEKSSVTSLDGVAVNSTVNFNGANGSRFRIGGTASAKHTGFCFVYAEGCLKLLPEGIGGSSTKHTVVDATEWATLKEQDIAFRAEFDKVDSDWQITVYINDVKKGTYNLGAAQPGLYLANYLKVTLNADEETAGPIEPSGEYTEKTLSDWSIEVGKLYGLNVYSLANAGSFTSLDRAAISGTVNYNGIEKAYFRIGGNEKAKHAGFAFMDNDGCLRLVTQGIDGDATPYTILNQNEWNELKEKEFDIRVTFDRDADTGKWSLGVFINSEYKGSYDCGTANPGMYIARDDNVTFTMQEAQSPDDKVYTELRFEDWGIYCGTVSGMDIYRLKGHDEITSLHGVAISGKVNFNGASRKYIAVGGTDKLKNGGFWLGAVEEKRWLVAAQGIGGANQQGILLSTAAKFKDEVNVRMTFWQEETNKWTIGVYADEVYVGSYTCEEVQPDLYLGINPLVTVEGLGDTVKNAGLDFTLFGYGNDTWRKEMGLE